jgi:RecA-family ATPase
MLPEGLTILAGSPKTGKSWLALSIAIAASCAGKIFGELPVLQYETLYISLEDTPRRLQSRLKFLGANPSEKLHFVNSWEQGNKGLEQLELWKIVYPNTKFIIIDTLQAFRGMNTTGLQSYAEDYDCISSLKRISDSIQTPIFCLHHTRKMRSRDPADMVSGTLGITGAADTIWVLTRKRKNPEASLFVTSRDFEEQKVILKFVDQVGWTYCGDSTEYVLSKQRQEIINIFKESSDDLSPKDINDVLKKNINTIKSLIRKLEEEGFLIKVTYGKYRYNKVVNSVTGVNSCNTVTGVNS